MGPLLFPPCLASWPSRGELRLVLWLLRRQLTFHSKDLCTGWKSSRIQIPSREGNDSPRDPDGCSWLQLDNCTRAVQSIQNNCWAQHTSTKCLSRKAATATQHAQSRFKSRVCMFGWAEALPAHGCTNTLTHKHPSFASFVQRAELL